MAKEKDLLVKEKVMRLINLKRQLHARMCSVQMRSFYIDATCAHNLPSICGNGNARIRDQAYSQVNETLKSFSRPVD